MGGEFLVGLSKSVRSAAGVQAGDEVQVELVLDTEERAVELPEELTAALAGDLPRQRPASTACRTRTARSAPAGSPSPRSRDP